MGIVFRTVFVYVLMWACFRALGKRELAKMSPFEFVLLLLIPQLFSRALPSQDYSMTNAVVGATTLLGVVFLTSLLSYRFPRFGAVMTAKPTVLVDRGHFVQASLDRERIDPRQIFTSMHKHGIEDLAQVRWAILEPDGEISVVREEQSTRDVGGP